MSDTPHTSSHLRNPSGAMGETVAAPSPVITRDVGQAERALRALLDRELDKVGLSFPAWAILAALDGGGPLTSTVLIQRLVDGHVVSSATAARTAVDDLLSTGMIAFADVKGVAGVPGNGYGNLPLARTPLADAVYRPAREAVGGITRELHHDLPIDDLEVTRRTLGTIARRANALLLGSHSAPGAG